MTTSHRQRRERHRSHSCSFRFAAVHPRAALDWHTGLGVAWLHESTSHGLGVLDYDALRDDRGIHHAGRDLLLARAEEIQPATRVGLDAHVPRLDVTYDDHGLLPALAWEQFEKVAKIFFMIMVATLVINTKERLCALVWVIALSIGFYGVKGGLFTLMTGGGFHVRGPSGTFIDGNNEIGLALCMTVPLLFFLRQIAPAALLRHAMVGAIVLTITAALGTQSRGALVGLAAMGTFLWLKSRNKVQIGLLIAASLLILVPFMPDAWTERMYSIRNTRRMRRRRGESMPGEWLSTWLLRGFPEVDSRPFRSPSLPRMPQS